MANTTSFETILNPAAFFRKLGGLHDAEIQRFEWATGVVMLDIDDLFANFLGLPEYPGLRPARVSFSGVQEVSLALDSSPDERLTVYSCAVTEGISGEPLGITIQLAPGGLIRIRCRSVEGDFDPTTIVVAQ